MTQGFPIARFNADIVRPSAPEHIQGAIFDLDGTLIDSMPWWDDLGESYLRRRGKTPAPDVRYHFKRLTMEEAAHYMQREYGLEESIEEICEGVMSGIVDAYREEIPLKPGVKGLLQVLHDADVRMCIATATEPYCAYPVLERLSIRDFFQDVLICSELRTSKTQPFIFQRALELLGTPPERTLVFEDALHAIEGAHAAGLPVLAVEEKGSAADREAIMQTADIYWCSFASLSA